jgi:hypothetical protein
MSAVAVLAIQVPRDEQEQHRRQRDESERRVE